jgi:sec-independent protein translocase protein TatA
MFGLGIWELLLILLVIVILFSRRLPDLGHGLAKGIRNFRRTMNEPDEIDVTPKDETRKEKDKRSAS